MCGVGRYLLLLVASAAAYSLSDPTADHTEAAIAFADAGDMEAAVESFRAAASFAPDVPEHWQNLAEALGDEEWAGSYSEVAKAAARDARRKAEALAAKGKRQRRRRRTPGAKRRRRRRRRRGSGKAGHDDQATAAAAAANPVVEGYGYLNNPEGYGDGTAPFPWETWQTWEELSGAFSKVLVSFGKAPSWLELLGAIILGNLVLGRVITDAEILISAVTMVFFTLMFGLFYTSNVATLVIVLRLVVSALHAVTGFGVELTVTEERAAVTPALEGQPAGAVALAAAAPPPPADPLKAAFVGERTKVGPNAARRQARRNKRCSPKK